MKFSKILSVFLVISILTSILCSCDTLQNGVSCKVDVLKENNPKSEKYEGNEFKVGEKIYLLASIAITNTDDNSTDDIVDFEFRVRSANYFSTIDCISAEIIPTEYEEYDDENGIRVKRISGMGFSVLEGRSKAYTYIFEIEPSEPCENVEIEFTFKSAEQSVLKADKTVIKTLSFVLAEEVS